MKISPSERQTFFDIFRDELEEASRRINERLSRFECRPVPSGEQKYQSVRRFYEDLADNLWTQADEEYLSSLSDLSEGDMKAAMREAFRRSPVHPIPSFRYLMNFAKKGGTEPTGATARSSVNPDAVSAAERERLANLLEAQLSEAAREIVIHLKLNDTRAAILREQLEVAQGQIIGRFTPLI